MRLLKLPIFYILILATLLRLAGLFINPPSLYGDELVTVYDGYSILKTGYDQTGEFLPVSFKMADNRPPAYTYLSLPFIALFGPGVLGVRLLSALSGIGLTVVVFLLVGRLIGKKEALAASLLAAISPWDLMLSRGGFESHLALFLTLLGVYLTFKFSNSWKLILAALTFSLALNTYPTYKLTVPFVVLALIIFLKLHHKLSLTKIISGLLLTLVVLLIVFRGLFIGSEGRFLNINIFSQESLREEMAAKIAYERKISSLASSTIFHNKLIEYLDLFGRNYLQSFGTEFLFISGDTNPRHNMANMGEFYLIELVLIILGIHFLTKRDLRFLFFLLSILLIAPIPTALVSEPHALRSSLVLLPLLILSGLGLYSLVRFRLSLVVALILLTIQFTFFGYRLYFLSTNKHSNFWSNSAKVASNIASGEKTQYIFISSKIDNAEYAYITYQKVDPTLVIDQNRKPSTLNGLKFKKFTNIYIGEVPQNDLDKFIKSLKGTVTYIGDITEQPFILDYEVIKDKDLAPRLVVRRKE